MNLTQIAGKSQDKLTKLERGFWEALGNAEFQKAWNAYRRDFLAAAVGSVSGPVEADAGTQRTFRLVDRTYTARFLIGLVSAAPALPPIAVGIISFEYLSDSMDAMPFFAVYFDDEGHFGVEWRELNQAVFNDADSLCGLFEQMAEVAMKRFVLLTT